MEIFTLGVPTEPKASTLPYQNSLPLGIQQDPKLLLYHIKKSSLFSKGHNIESLIETNCEPLYFI